MNDNDIIKALECCSNADCVNCPKWSEEWHSGTCADFLPMVLDLINRQRAEIEEYHALQVMTTEALVDRRQKAIFGD